MRLHRGCHPQDWTANLKAGSYFERIRQRSELDFKKKFWSEISLKLKCVQYLRVCGANSWSDAIISSLNSLSCWVSTHRKASDEAHILPALTSHFILASWLLPSSNSAEIIILQIYYLLDIVRWYSKGSCTKNNYLSLNKQILILEDKIQKGFIPQRRVP